MLTALIFIKNLADAKSRLATVLSPLERAALATRLLMNVIDATRGASGVGEVVVVSPDPQIPAILGRRNVLHIREPRTDDLNAAILFASAALTSCGTKRAVILPADLPRIACEHVDALIDAHERSGADLIVPSTDGAGTNALLIELPPRFPLAFGTSSFHRHLASAARSKRRLDIHRCAAISTDIDLPDDLQHLPLELVS
jgi:2-phospho-L-lactate guanylyltransferase